MAPGASEREVQTPQKWLEQGVLYTILTNSDKLWSRDKTKEGGSLESE